MIREALLYAADMVVAIIRMQFADMKIQYATSLTYPPITMGAHVSVVPNQQTGRVSPLATRGYVAMSGNFGYELDLGNLTDEELEYVKEQIQCYKMIRPVIQHGDFLSDKESVQ